MYSSIEYNTVQEEPVPNILFTLKFLIIPESTSSLPRLIASCRSFPSAARFVEYSNQKFCPMCFGAAEYKGDVVLLGGAKKKIAMQTITPRHPAPQVKAL